MLREMKQQSVQLPNKPKPEQEQSQSQLQPKLVQQPQTLADSPSTRKQRVKLPLQGGYSVRFLDATLEREYEFQLSETNVLASSALRKIFRSFVINLSKQYSLANIELGTIENAHKVTQLNISQTQDLHPDAILCVMNYLYLLKTYPEWKDFWDLLEKNCLPLLQLYMENEEKKDKLRVQSEKPENSKNLDIQSKESKSSLKTSMETNPSPKSLPPSPTPPPPGIPFKSNAVLKNIFNLFTNYSVFLIESRETFVIANFSFLNKEQIQMVTQIVDQVYNSLFMLQFMWNFSVFQRVYKVVHFLGIKQLQMFMNFFICFSCFLDANQKESLK